MKAYIKTLGCEKNTVDSEYAAGILAENGCFLTDDPSSADFLIVNTCGFINDAKQQSIEAIFDLIRELTPKQKLIVSGCLAQRYVKELLKEIPEADYYIGVNNYESLADIVRKNTDSNNSDNNSEVSVPLDLVRDCGKIFDEYGQRLYAGGATASIKIAEGCNNICSYCIIPFIRGKYRSRQPENIVAEAKMLAERGCRELIVIAQDVTFYGRDLKQKNALPSLLKELCRIEGIEWIRLMYCYEDEISDELINTIKSESKICKYIDIPIQHCSTKILKAMNRKSTGESIISTVEKLRKEIPGIIIRTTLITGFPGETKDDFLELCEFVNDMKFDRLGVFAYSKEEGTAAALMKPQVRKDVKERRRDRIMEIQREISLEHNVSLIGTEQKVLVEEALEDGTYLGRTFMDAPDIDNSVLFTSKNPVKPGMFVNVKITDAFDYDLCAEVI